MSNLKVEEYKELEQLKFGLELNARLLDGSITKKQLKEKFDIDKEKSIEAFV